jgi:hypothetical protein
MPKVTKEEMKALIDAGYSVHEIAEKIGKTAKAVYGITYRFGLSFGNGTKGRKFGFKPKPKPAPQPEPPKPNQQVPRQFNSNTVRPRHAQCVWHKCKNLALPGKPYCDDHKSAILTGIMKPIS